MTSRKCAECPMLFQARLGPEFHRFCSKVCRTRAWARQKYRDTDQTTKQFWNFRSDLMKHYGIRPEDFERMLAEQDGKCAICGQDAAELPRRIDVDHDHDTGAIRGLLCSGCNVGIGRFRHNPDLLLKAVSYLLNVKAWIPERSRRRGRR